MIVVVDAGIHIELDLKDAPRSRRTDEKHVPNERTVTNALQTCCEHVRYRSFIPIACVRFDGDRYRFRLSVEVIRGRVDGSTTKVVARERRKICPSLFFQTCRILNRILYCLCPIKPSALVFKSFLHCFAIVHFQIAREALSFSVEIGGF